MGASLRKGLCGFCGFCVNTAKWVPVIFITAIIVWSYYAYVVQLCFFTIPDLDGWGMSIVLLLSFHLFLIPLVWSYHQTIFMTPGNVPARFQLSVCDMDAVESASDSRLALERLVVDRDLPVFMRSARAEVRYCSECSSVKPDRSHHCSVCGACVLKMDHHCPWVNNCIGFANYKFFVLFLFYATTYCLFVALSTLRYFLTFWSSSSGMNSGGKFHVLFLFFVGAMFCASLLSLLLYHMFLVCHNRTTLESFRAPTFRHGTAQGDKRAFHLGTLSNLQEVFGDTPVLWFVPIFTTLGDGLVYPRREMALDEEGARVGDVELGRRPWDGSGSEELVPMIHATRFESDDEEEGNKMIDRHARLSTTSSSGISAGSAAVLDVEVSENRLSTQVHNPRQDPVLKDQLVAVDMA